MRQDLLVHKEETELKEEKKEHGKRHHIAKNIWPCTSQPLRDTI